MRKRGHSLFGSLLRKFRLKAEIESLPELCDLLVEKGFVYEESTLSRWQNGNRIPARRKVLFALIKTFAERGGVTLLSEANQLMEAADKGYLTEKELADLPPHLLYKSPFQIPRITPHFVGREREIDKIFKILTRGENSLVVIYGLPGVGKTVLAIRIAQLLQGQFPDGIVWSRLDVSSPMTILAKIANTYGAEVMQIKDLQARSEMVRSILAHKKALIIFDNAQNSKQLRSFLPGNTKCCVIVTSRDSSLEALSDATSINLKPFTPKENLLFFTKRLGNRWVERYKEEACDISKLVGSLPLALDIVVNRIASLGRFLLGDFIRDLKREKQRLAALSYDDVGVRSSLELSYQSLSADSKTIFDRLGIFGGVDFSLEAVCSLFNGRVSWVKKGLGELFNKSLLEYSTRGRYRFHPLIKLYAKEKLRDKTYYLKLAAYYSKELDKIVGNWSFARYQNIEQDIENIISLCHWCLAQKEMEVLDKLWENTSQFLFEIGLWEELLSLGQGIYNNCRIPCHWRLKAECAVNLLSWVALWRGELKRAQKWATEGLKIAEKIKDKPLTALARLRLGNITYYNRDYPGAMALLTSSQKMFERLNDKGRVARALIYLGHIPQKQGKFRVAQGYFRKSLKVAKSVNDKRATCVALTNLGNLAREEGNFIKARAYIAKSRQIAYETKRHDACDAWNNYRLAWIEWDLRHYKKAKNFLLKAQKEFRQLDMKGVLKDADIVLRRIEKQTTDKIGLYW